MAEVVIQAHEEALLQGAGTYSLLFPLFFWYSLCLAMTLSTFADIDIGTKESELAIAEKAKRLIPSVQTIGAQLVIPQTTHRPEGLQLPEGGDTTIGEAS